MEHGSVLRKADLNQPFVLSLSKGGPPVQVLRQAQHERVRVKSSLSMWRTVVGGKRILAIWTEEQQLSLTYDRSRQRNDDGTWALAMVRSKLRRLLDRFPCWDVCFIRPLLAAAYRTVLAWAPMLVGDLRYHAP